MTRHFLSFFLLMLAVGYVKAQTIERQVMASSGVDLSNGSSSVNFTVGETVIGSLSNGQTLHQGFHHVSDAPVSIAKATENRLSTFPNPFENGFTLNTSLEGDYKYFIYNMQGQLVQTGMANGNHFISLENASSGMYKLSVCYNQGISITNLSINKK